MTQELDQTPVPAPEPAADSVVAEVSKAVAPPLSPSLAARLGAEALGTFMLVFFGVGAALLGSSLGLGQLGVALAFGIAVIAGVAAVGHVSGGYFNPAVTLGLALAGRHSWRDVLPYWVVQAASGIVATLVLFVAMPKTLVTNGAGSSTREEFFKAASNGFGAHGPAYNAAEQAAVNDLVVNQGATKEQIASLTQSGQLDLHGSINFTWGAALLVEIIATAVFVGVILAVTDKRSPIKFQPVVIGLTLAGSIIVAMPFTNSSINPARSLASAVWAGGWTWGQLWVFIVGPLVGGAIAALFYRGFAAERAPVPAAAPEGAPLGAFFTDASGQPFTTPTEAPLAPPTPAPAVDPLLGDVTDEPTTAVVEEIEVAEVAQAAETAAEPPTVEEEPEPGDEPKQG